jgi:hypothetical protein
MADVSDVITTIVTSLPGQFVSAGVIAGIVWKGFDMAESILNDDTKLEIAIWLLGFKTAEKVKSWPETFVRVFDRVFGTKHLSWKCFWRSAVASVVTATIVYLALLGKTSSTLFTVFGAGVAIFLNRVAVPTWAAWVIFSLIFNIVPDYLSLLKTRRLLGIVVRSRSACRTASILAMDALLTMVIALVPVTAIGVTALREYDRSILAQAAQLPPQDFAKFESIVRQQLNVPNRKASAVSKRILDGAMGIIEAKRSGDERTQWRILLSVFLWPFALAAMSIIAPAFFTSVWLWLYVGSGFLIQAAPRFDVAFQWLNRKLDIERRPLHSIGVVSGFMVAVAYGVVRAVLVLVERLV